MHKAEPPDDFERVVFSAGAYAHGVYQSPAPGPAVILLHEAPNLTPEVIDLARHLRDAGFRIFMPSLVGEDGASAPNPSLLALGEICIRTEFAALMGRSTRPVVAWIRALAQKIASDHGGPVGVIGLCFSGGFALGAAVEPAVTAAVACEPALPLAGSIPGVRRVLGAARAIDLDTADSDSLRKRLAARDLAVQAYRFAADDLSPCARMLALGERLGPAFEGRCLSPALDAEGRAMRRPHSIITSDLVDVAGHPTVEDRKSVV